MSEASAEGAVLDGVGDRQVIFCLVGQEKKDAVQLCASLFGEGKSCRNMPSKKSTAWDGEEGRLLCICAERPRKAEIKIINLAGSRGM